MPKHPEWIKRKIQHSILITEIVRDYLQIQTTDCTKLLDYKQIASYSWSSQSRTFRPLIAVPGRPNVLIQNLNTLIGQHVPYNDSRQIMDENSLHLPNHPMEPIFRSISLCSPTFDYSKIDFVTDRNNLRKLLRFVEKSADRSFVIDFEKVGSLILMNRREQNSMVDGEGYGKEFENMASFTNQDYSGHRVIVTYKFGDFNFLTRFEVDCVQEESSPSQFGFEERKFSDSSKLSFIKDGEFGEKTLIELTCKSNQKFPTKKIGQMFFSKTDYLVIGRHKNGLIEKIEKLSLEKVTERFNQPKQVLGKLNSLLGYIKSLIGQEKCLYSLVYDNEEKSLKLYKLNNYLACLPKDILNEFSNKNIQN